MQKFGIKFVRLRVQMFHITRRFPFAPEKQLLIGNQLATLVNAIAFCLKELASMWSFVPAPAVFIVSIRSMLGSRMSELYDFRHWIDSIGG